MLSLMAWVAGPTFVGGFLMELARGSSPEEGLATSVIRAWVAGELAAAWWRWVCRQPRKPAGSDIPGAAGAVPEIEGAG